MALTASILGAVISAAAVVAEDNTGNAEAAAPTLSLDGATWSQAHAQQALYAGLWGEFDPTYSPVPSHVDRLTQITQAWIERGALDRLQAAPDDEAAGRDGAPKCKLAFPGTDPEDSICPGDFATTIKCYMCLQKPENQIKLKTGEKCARLEHRALPTPLLQAPHRMSRSPAWLPGNCSKGLEKSFCDPGPTLTSACSSALTSAFGSQAMAHNPMDVYQGLGSWSTQINGAGHYYQCNALDGFHYWKGMLSKFTSPPLSQSAEVGDGKGGKGGQQQSSVAVCIPDECSNDDDAKRIVSDYVHYGLLHYWLTTTLVYEPEAPPLDTNAKIVLGVMIACATLCLMSTLLNSSWMTTCKVALPMEENVAKRVKVLLAKFPEREDEVAKMGQLDKWQFIQEMEAVVESGIPPEAPSIQTDDMLNQSLIPPSQPRLQPLNVQSSKKAHADLGFCGKLLACWDLGFNWRTGLMKQDGGVPEMRVLNGLRVLSMGWVVLCHGFLYQLMDANVQNKIYAEFDVGQRFISQLLPNGNFSVDTFFVLSGYLGAYVGMRKLNAMDRAGKKVPNPFVIAFNFLLERYLRLTPAYAFVLMFYMYVLPHLVSGPNSVFAGGSPILNDKIPDDFNANHGDFFQCQKYVWTNLLYISNLLPFHDTQFDTKYGKQWAGGAFGLHNAHGGMGCMGHSWFLSNDFQMHLLLPWLLVLFRWNPKAAYGVMLTCISASLAYLGFLVHEYNWSLGCHDRGFTGNQNSLVYGKPWCRISPWMLGVILACYQSANTTRAGYLKPPGAMAIAVGYTISCGIFFVCVFTPYWQTHHPFDPTASQKCGWSHTYDTIYSIFCRAAWGCGICFLIYAALTCQGGPLTRFFTWSFWTPFARLTYGWYLIHPLVMQVIYESNRE